MKKIILAASFIMLCTITACKNGNTGGKTDAAAVPEAVITAFNAKYPGVSDVKWEQESNQGKVLFDGEFTMNDKKMEARFDDAGNFVDEK